MEIVSILMSFSSVFGGEIFGFLFEVFMISFEIFTFIKNRIKKKAEAEDSEELEETKFKKIFKKFSKGFLVTNAVIFIFLFLSVTVFLEMNLKFIFKFVEKKTDIIITYNDSKCNVFSGKFEFDNFTAKRTESKLSEFNLEIEKIRFDYSLLSTFRKNIEVEEVYIKGVSGAYNQIEGESDKILLSTIKSTFTFKDKKEEVKKETKTNKRKLIIRKFKLEDVNLNGDFYVLGKNIPLKFTLDKLENNLIRSEFALFDLIYGSYFNAKIYETKFISELGDKSSTWNIEEFDLKALQILFDRNKTKIKGGLIKLKIENTWKDKGRTRVKTKAYTYLKDVDLKRKEKMAIFKFQGKIYKKLENNLEKRDYSNPIILDLKFMKEAFRAKENLQSVGFFKTLSKALLNYVKDSINNLEDEEIKEDKKNKE